MKITEEQFKKLFPKTKNISEWIEALEVVEAYEINTVNRFAAFLAQCSHESQDFTRLSENLNYTNPKRLIDIWPSRFSKETAPLYAGNPEKLANKVYANRLGNGDENSGDGYKYRGRGILQLTGKSNYALCSKDIFGDDTLITNPDVLLQPSVAVLSACWFWKINNLNSICDRGDIISLTKKINGGTIGLAERENKYKEIKEILSNS